MHEVVVVGGGAAGMVAAYTAATKGNRVILLEKNEKLGKKLYITGKGRCNLTNNVPVAEFLNNVVNNSKFLYGALNAFSPEDTLTFFENNGCKLKTERGNRVFPVSDKSSDIIKTLQNALVSSGVDFRLNTEVLSIIARDGKVYGVKTDKGEIFCDSLIICTGGVSYPLTGSTGDGYKFAKNVGHTIVSPKPSLVGLELKGDEFLPLQGLSLKNVAVSFIVDGREVYHDFGEMLFTHFGLSGPMVLSASAHLRDNDFRDVKVSIDLKPALDRETLEKRILSDFAKYINRDLGNALGDLLPQKMILPFLTLAGLDVRKKVNVLTKAERERMLDALKGFVIPISGFRPIEEAIVTSGGVDVKEIYPKTMMSRKIDRLFFAGEMIDVDAYTGGFNLQIAFSTGYLAGLSASLT